MYTVPFFRKSQILTIHQLHDFRLCPISHRNFYCIENRTETNKSHTHEIRCQILASNNMELTKPINKYELMRTEYAANKIGNSSPIKLLSIKLRMIMRISKFILAAKE